MEISNVASSSGAINGASFEEGESFNFPIDEDEIVVKGAFCSSFVTESELTNLSTASTSRKNVEETKGVIVRSRTAAFHRSSDEDDVDESDEGESDSSGDEDERGEQVEDDVADCSSVGFSALASELATPLWTRERTLALLNGPHGLFLRLPFVLTSLLPQQVSPSFLICSKASLSLATARSSRVRSS
jgi:hypothetical protein